MQAVYNCHGRAGRRPAFGSIPERRDALRLDLALALCDGRELCVCDLAWVVQRPQNLTSHHMKVLKGAGIVAARKQGKMTMYRLTREGSRLAENAVAGPTREKA